MKLISSKYTFFNKWSLPVFSFGGLLACCAGAYFSPSVPMVDKKFDLVVFAIVILVLFGVSRLRPTFMDKVYDDGDSLVVRNRGREERIPLMKISNVRCSKATYPATNNANAARAVRVRE